MFLRLSESLWRQKIDIMFISPFIIMPQQFNSPLVFYRVLWLLTVALSSASNSTSRNGNLLVLLTISRFWWFALYIHNVRWLLCLKSTCARQSYVNWSVRNQIFSRLIILNMWIMLQAHLLYTFKNSFCLCFKMSFCFYHTALT